jgi:PEP-CTERM motif
MMKRLVLAAIVLAATVSTPAFAGTTVFTGNTTGGPTYNRPLSGFPPTNLSGVGTAVRYVVNPFTVSTSGAYNFLNLGTYDTYLGIHNVLFNPLNALQNAVAYNDDFGGSLSSGFTALTLTAGVSYFAVSSGFSNSDFGAFTLTISGPGNITGGGLSAVPEPAAWAMMIAGFGFVGAAMRRRVTKVSYA